MKKYHPARYPLIKASVEAASSRVNWRMRELAMLHGANSQRFKQGATSLVAEETPNGISFKRSQKFKNAIDSVHEFWKEQGSVLFDINSLAEVDASDLDDCRLTEFGMPAPHFYLHFGEELGFHLERQPSVFIDGVYVMTVPKGGRNGFSLAFVTNEAGWEERSERTYGEEMEAAGRIAAAWVALDEPLSGTLRRRAIAGDSTVTSDPTMDRVLNEMDEMIGRLCAAEHERTFTYAGTRH